MAKAGSDEARELTRLAQMARGAVDIQRDVPDGIKRGLLEQIEGQLGLRCGGCGRRIKVGFQFTRLDVVLLGEHPKADVLKLSACDRDDCTFAEEAREGADVVEMVEYAWLVDVDEERSDSFKSDGAQTEAPPHATESGVFPAGSGAPVAHMDVQEVGEGEPYPEMRRDEPEGNGSTAPSE